MANEAILLVEDDQDIQELIRYNFAKEGYDIRAARTGEEALMRVRTKLPDLVLLDIMLPGIDGLEVCRSLKRDRRTQHIPVVMLTAKGEESDIVIGLELGADDYVTKPFSPKVLLARVRAILRRKTSDAAIEGTESLSVGDLTIHPHRHEVLLSGAPIDLTATEFRILHFLARRKGWVYTRFQIVDAVHGEGYPVTDRSVDVQIVGLRKKLGPTGRCIQTVRGVGYRFRE
jgi:two-component system alkaline phosphatase synthesis response regulator PhoP